MYIFPNSSAMDATAAGGGPITFLPRIVTGSPEQIMTHVTQVLDKARHFISLMDEFAKAEKQLAQVWSGKAADGALKKISDSVQSFEKIIKVVQEGAQLLGVAGGLVKAAQHAYQSVVSAVNPTVAALMSNPWTHAAARALSSATSASLRAFIESIGALLKTLGVVKLGTQLSTLAGIIGQLEELFGGSKSQAATGGGTPTDTSTVSSTPVTAPQTPPPVASTSGQQAVQQAAATNPITNYTPAALNGFTGNTANTANSWIPVDPAPTPVATTPATTPVGTPTTPAMPSNNTITVTTTIDGESTKVELPADHDVDVDVQVPVHGQTVTEHISVTGLGKVAAR
ncbi:WXG100 family type VII secretion target [Kutzneria albida]|uniref:Uncharacterized protein n=1 Tax=Kutzneria albida DSM 43870 TaxID=1449976 RepID=W5WEY7_9PSEU|nr:hypothetical protein [Kutzneria albida]AHH99417.1 hypothetical protein KALB_6057 [Kutzneria albida DSM 43870]